MKLFIALFCLLSGPAGADEGLEASVAEQLDASWPIRSVEIINRTLAVKTDLRQVNQAAYTYMVASMCLVLVDHEGAVKQLEEVVFLNRFGAQGWVYEKPANCDKILHTRGKDLEFFIASHTHTYSQFSK